MGDQVRAHYDGGQVVLDEPAPFQQGEELVVSRADAGDGARLSPLEQLVLQQGNRELKTLGDFIAEMAPPPPDEPDLFEIIMEDRRKRRQAAAEKDETDLFS